ncbi:VOC family protein [Nitrospira sp. KM1]|uniref:VOC family protein n=1 Tax=Nitrospira sp. KM1 TaxID=1936990 RepID=UPI0013A7698E|nr:VOC family protein [Nitrospira sp. KM1]BCA55660.1 VOC family protein [Nitrospira sp. KM1]
MLIQPYVFFDGRCEEAAQFYVNALGAKVGAMMRFQDSPGPASCPSGDGQKIMHLSVRIGETVVMASDGRCGGHPAFEGFALSLMVQTEEEADHYFGALAVGGRVEAPLARTFFSRRFGMVADKFGVSWMIVAAP